MTSPPNFNHGYTYQWNIYGPYYGSSYGQVGDAAAMDSAKFVLPGSGTSTTSAQSVSFSNTYVNGEGAYNGSFQFQVQ
jgi:hypothetical protein